MLPRFLLLIAGVTLLSSLPAAAQEAGRTGVASLPRGCGVCHLERIESSGEAFNFLALRTVEGAGEKGICYSCHNGVVKDSRRSAWAGRQHRASGRDVDPGPGKEPSCGTCHDPHVQEEGVATFMRHREGTYRHCTGCHSAKLSDGHPSAASRGGKLPDCGVCHRVHRARGAGLIVAASLSELCASCHGENPSRAGVGAGQQSHPTEEGRPDCDTCHPVHRRFKGKIVRQSVLDSRLCLECHEGHAAGKGGEVNHPLGKAGVECLSCHRVHNAAPLDGRSALLAVAPGEFDTVCRSCHESLAGSVSSWNHPVGLRIENPDEPKLEKLKSYGGHLGPAGEVQCISCHKSHKAFPGTAGLVVKNQALCLYCHAAQNSLAPKAARFGTHPVSVRPDKAIISPQLLKAGGETGPTGELICITCHRTHGGKEGTAGLVLSREKYSCSICHTAEAEIVSTPHRSAGGKSDPCLDCHDHHGWGIPLEEAQMGGSVVEKVCWHCHGAGGSAPMSGYFGHVVGVPPSSVIRGRDLPLFWSDGRRLENGLITCATCHDAHRSPGGNFLRITGKETRSDLCLGCHRAMEAVSGTKHDISLYFPNEKNRRGESAAQTGPCGACHVVHSGGPGESWARDIAFAPGAPGELSAFCSNCHQEGAFAQGKIVQEKGHPSLDILDELPDAEIIDCDGCHNPHVWNPLDRSDKGDFFVPGTEQNSFLVKPDGENSRLCLGCHSDKKTVQGSKHDFSGGEKAGSPCRECHLSHGGDTLLMWSAPLEDKEDFGSGTCLLCHGADGYAPSDALEGPGHPLGVNPGPDTGEDLPRFSASGRRFFRGNVACATCHDPHTWSPLGSSAPAAAGPSTSFLRLPADGFSPICFPCHANRSLVVGTDHDLRITAPDSVNLDGAVPEESGVCGSCHKVHGAAESLALWNRDAGRGIDPQSRYCRSCHEEGTMEEATVPERLELHLVEYPGKGQVGRPFTKQSSSFSSISTSGFELFNEKGQKDNHGYISCATCHDAHRWEPDTTRSGTGIPLDGDLKNSFLKVRNTFAVGKAFCRKCHEDDTLEHYQLYHDPEYDGSPQ